MNANITRTIVAHRAMLAPARVIVRNVAGKDEGARLGISRGIARDPAAASGAARRAPDQTVRPSAREQAAQPGVIAR